MARLARMNASKKAPTYATYIPPPWALATESVPKVTPRAMANTIRASKENCIPFLRFIPTPTDDTFRQ